MYSSFTDSNYYVSLNNSIVATEVITIYFKTELKHTRVMISVATKSVHISKFNLNSQKKS